MQLLITVPDDPRVWAEQYRKECETRGLKTEGPCIICGEHTRYSYCGAHRNWGNSWLSSQFEDRQRRNHFEAFCGSRTAFPGRRQSKSIYRAFVCDGCTRKGWNGKKVTFKAHVPFKV
jgi:hypothetical protein